MHQLTPRPRTASHATPLLIPGEARLDRRSGFSLVETLVAMMIFGVGGLALAATTAIAVSRSGAAHTRSLAARIAGTQLDRLASLRCSAHSPGSLETRGLHIEWRSRNDAGWATITVVISSLHSAESWSFSMVVQCH